MQMQFKRTMTQSVAQSRAIAVLLLIVVVSSSIAETKDGLRHPDFAWRAETTQPDESVSTGFYDQFAGTSDSSDRNPTSGPADLGQLNKTPQDIGPARSYTFAAKPFKVATKKSHPQLTIIENTFATKAASQPADTTKSPDKKSAFYVSNSASKTSKEFSVARLPDPGSEIVNQGQTTAPVEVAIRPVNEAVEQLPQPPKSELVLEPESTVSNPVQPSPSDAVVEAGDIRLETAPTPLHLGEPVEHVSTPVTINDGRLFQPPVNLPDWSGIFGGSCSVCSQSVCCCSKAVWSSQIDTLFLHRSHADAFGGFLASSNLANDGVLSEDVDLDFEVAPRVQIARSNLCGGLDVEAIYFRVEEFAGTDSHFGDLLIRDTNLLGSGTAFVDYESKMQNVELNVSKYYSNWTKLLIGVRWMQIDEDSSISASTIAFPSYRDLVHIDNDLLGGQFGIQHLIWDRGYGFTMHGTLKFGVLSNELDRSTVGFGSTPLSDRTTALLGDLDLSANYKITDHWSLTAGYQLIAVSDVGLGLNQFFSPNAIHTDEVAIFNGLRVGASVSW